MQGPHIFSKTRYIQKLDVATSKKANLDLNLHALRLQLATSNSQN